MLSEQVCGKYPIIIYKYLENILCFFSSKDEYVKTTDKLIQRLDSAKSVPRTQSFYCVRLLADTKKLELK